MLKVAFLGKKEENRGMDGGRSTHLDIILLLYSAISGSFWKSSLQPPSPILTCLQYFLCQSH